MSEVAEAPEQAEATAGGLLRRAREAAGLHVAALAVSLKVPVRKLEALEDNRFDDLGDAVFIRALASSVCRNLKVDPQPILERLPQTSAPRLVRDGEGLNAPFRAPGDGPAPSWVDSVRQPVPLAVLALLVGAVVIYFLPVSHMEEKAVAAAPAAAPAQSAAPVAFVPAPSVADQQPAPAPAAQAPASAPAVQAAAAKPAAPAASMPPATAVQAAAPASAQPATNPPAVAPANGIVVLRTRGESWVEVVDAKGGVPLRKLMAAGESAGASGPLPLTVTIGKVDMTEVEVRGRKFDLRPVSKDNVARFEVK